MKVVAGFLFALSILFLSAGQAHAASGPIIVNTNCGPSPTPTPTNGMQATYVDQNGNLCQNSSGGGGGSNATIVGPLGQAAAAASVSTVAPLTTIAGASPTGTACSSSLAINQTSSTDLVTSVGKLHICAIVLVSATQQGISLSEGTGSTCGTGTALLMGGAGGTMQVAANGGFAQATPFPWLITKTTADHLCLLQSSTGNISGIITYSDN